MVDKAIRVIIILDKKGRARTGDCSRDSINKKLTLIIDKKNVVPIETFDQKWIEDLKRYRQKVGETKRETASEIFSPIQRSGYMGNL